MPQFDVNLFASQIFWLSVCMLSLYVFMSRVSIPRIYAMLEQRKEKINHDLHKSDELRMVAVNLQNEYEKIMADAKVKSNEIMVESLSKTALDNSVQRKGINQDMARRIQLAEDHLEISKIKASPEIRVIAAAVAGAVIQKVVRLDVPDKYMTETLNNSLEEQKAS